MFTKVAIQIGLKKSLWLTKLKSLCCGHKMWLWKFLEHFTEKKWKNKPKEFVVEKVIKRKGDKLHFKWKGYGNCFNS